MARDVPPFGILGLGDFSRLAGPRSGTYTMFIHNPNPSNVIVRARHDHGARRGAGGGGVDYDCKLPASLAVHTVAEAETIFGEGVEVRGEDLSTKGTDIGEAQIVCDDQEEVGSFLRGRHGCGMTWEPNPGIYVNPGFGFGRTTYELAYSLRVAYSAARAVRIDRFEMP